MREAITHILNLAVQAPSGENCQPWRFEVRDNQIKIYNRPERDQSLYNVDQKGSFIAHGALIENIIIAAPRFGYEATVTLLPRRLGEPTLVAIVTLSPTLPHEDPLCAAIANRVTNRKFYAPTSLTMQQRTALLGASQAVGAGEVRLLEGENERRNLADALSLNEQLLFGNYHLHQFLFQHIRWTETEEREKKEGMYLPTLELSPPQQFSFKLIKRWPIMKFLARLGMANAIAKENAKVFFASPTFAAVVVPGNTAQDYFLAGRIAQRLWLEVTRLELSAQAVTGILFLWQRLLAQQASALSPAEQSKVREAYHTIAQLFSVSEPGTIAMLFRIGVGGKPSATSSRLPPQIIFS